jgi:hypothetical protein
MGRFWHHKLQSPSLLVNILILPSLDTQNPQQHPLPTLVQPIYADNHSLFPFSTCRFVLPLFPLPRLEEYGSSFTDLESLRRNTKLTTSSR